MGWNPVKDAERAAKKVVDKVVNPAANAAKSAVNRVGDEVKSGVRKVGHEVESGVKRVAHDAESGIRSVANDAEDGITKAARAAEEAITERLPELAEDALEEVLKAAASGTIEKALRIASNVIEFLAPSKYSIIFGIELALVVSGEVTVTAEIPNPVSKLTEIQEWAESPPKGRAQIIQCLKDFGPESLTVEAKFSGNGGAATWDGEDKYDRVDAFLEEHGV